MAIENARSSAMIELYLVAAERRRINELWRSGKLKDEARRRIERELDLREAHLTGQRAEVMIPAVLRLSFPWV